MAKRKGLSLRVQWLGDRLREARIDAGYTMEDVAQYLELTGASISRFESGTLRIKRPYLKEMIDFYGVSGQREREALFQLNEDAWRKDWWEGETKDLEVGFLDHTWLEARALEIDAFEPLIIHGLLQTEGYVRAIAARGLPKASQREIDRMVELRCARQRILSSSDSPALNVVLEEPALRRAVGGPDIQREQLQHLLTLNRKRHVNIRVLPIDVDWDPGNTGPFTCFRMPDPFDDVGFLDTLAGRTFLEEKTKVNVFKDTYNDLLGLALSSRASITFIRETMEKL